MNIGDVVEIIGGLSGAGVTVWAAPRQKDLVDVEALADEYGFDVPASHQR